MAHLHRSERKSLRRLRELQFRRYTRCHELVGEFFARRAAIERHAQAKQIWKLHDWLLCPLTLWALDYVGIAKHLLGLLRMRKDFDADTILLLKLIDDVPSVFTQSQVGEYEKTVVNGLYDRLTRQPAKFAEVEASRRNDRELRICWNQIRSRFPLQDYRNERGVIRRTLSRERNFEAHRFFSWARRRDRFQLIFDALCYRWCLYGFELDQPLLLKVSVNPTPHGTMIVIPRHMSLDGTRDLDWPAIDQIHRSHGTPRQGPRLSSARIKREAMREKARFHDAEAKKLKLRGRARFEFILKAMGLEITRINWLRQLLRKPRHHGRPN